MIMMARDIPLSSFFSLIFFNLLGALMSIEKCTTMPACNSAAPFSVSFPFRLPVYQSNSQCGYSSGFNLWCSTYKETQLYILNSGYFSIENIDYSGQTVTVTDPNRCFPQRFLNMDFSSSPFSISPFDKYFHTYYNCTRSAVNRYQEQEVTCMSDTNYSVIVLLSENDPGPDVRDNCFVIESFVFAPLTLYLYPSTSNMQVELSWSEPQCGLCAAKGQTCGFKDGSSYLVECQNDTGGGRPSPPPPPPLSSRPPPPPSSRPPPPLSSRPPPPPSSRPPPPPSPGPSLRPSPPSEAKSGMSAFTLAMALIVPAVLTLILVAVCKKCSNTTSEQQQSNPQEPVQLIQTHPMTVTVTCPSAPPIEQDNLNPIFILGEGDVLLEQNVAPCAICLSEYKLGDILRTISDCNHYFHSDCVDEWLRTKATCPVCRKDV